MRREIYFTTLNFFFFQTKMQIRRQKLNSAMKEAAKSVITSSTKLGPRQQKTTLLKIVWKSNSTGLKINDKNVKKTIS